MKCDEIREKISCMLDNELNAEESALIEEHLASCPECMRVFEAFTAVSLAMGELEDVPDGFTKSVMRKVRKLTPAKKRKPRILYFAGLAACLAVVLLTGNRLGHLELPNAGRSSDTAGYVRLKTPEPAVNDSAITADTAVEGSTPGESEAGDNGTVLPDEQDGIMLATEDAATAVVTPTPAVTPTPVPTATPAVTATPVPTTAPLPELTALSDLLIVTETADAALHTDEPDYTVTVPAADGGKIHLMIWLEDARIYCKIAGTDTAWYTIGSPAKLMELLPAAPEPSVAPSPAVTPVVSDTTALANAA